MAKTVVIKPGVIMLATAATDTTPLPPSRSASTYFNLSPFSQGFELTSDLEQHDATTTENEGNTAMLAGLQSFSGTLNFVQDFDTGKLHDVLYPIVRYRKEVYFFLRPDASNPTSANNRLGVMTGTITSYSPMTASINSVLNNSVNIVPGPSGAGVEYYNIDSNTNVVAGEERTVQDGGFTKFPVGVILKGSTGDIVATKSKGDFFLTGDSPQSGKSMANGDWSNNWILPKS